MKFFVPYVFVGIAVFGATAFGQDGGDDTDTDIGTDTGMAASPTQTPANMYQPTPSSMMPGFMTGGIPPMNVVNVGGSGGPSRGQMPNMVQSLLSRLVSFFDLSHVASTTTDTPVTFDMVYDPSMGKFTHMTSNVMQSGDTYYVPVCSIDSITGTGTGTASAQGCDYGVRLNPVPLNVARAQLNIIHTLFAVLRNIARPAFMFGESSAMNTAQ
ncbi:hypothetical protein IW140_005461 [Coemansia sp. RSA 1813]|nr:hypothetical protein EV178_005435 [Coemansia sp. RSA 1646]KAJ1767500.1 hypothetical protein LPJ74_005327 [Coemansia sp. RSA 1843]KAJ2086767.1 hypothetical protein IW138_005445 [Coemansia sp. RSA 986]KAJ2211569.1 hypothetical protein EV179_005380 [Coemansia sp. RSA 487]KAJ2565121.1 hypothetical protein IW140_005461 [Coemansia sp. RSA 1813]